MEGNGCYKYSTIKRFIEFTGQPGIKTAVDIGMCDGDTVREIREWFPEAFIHGYEVVPSLHDECVQNLFKWFQMSYIRTFNEAVTHSPGTMVINQGGNKGGSFVSALGKGREGYTVLSGEPVVTVPLEVVIGRHGGHIDFIKMDCEGCERSILEHASSEALSRIRFICGEYHNLPQFRKAVDNGNLRETHKLYTGGAYHDGSFVAVRLGPDCEIFENYQAKMRGFPHIETAVFKQRYIEPGTGWWHDRMVEIPESCTSVYEELVDREVYYRMPDQPDRRMVLRAEGQLGAGGMEGERQWGITEYDGIPTFIFEGGHGLMCKMTRTTSDLWEGSWCCFDKRSVSLLIGNKVPT